MYRPRVQAAVAGQSLSIRNSDQTLHNVHGYKGPSTLFNQAEIPGMPAITKKLSETDQVLKFKCDVHPWMTGYVVVSSNPFFAVTGDDGSFRITGLPPGSYTLEAWHERFGAKTAKITVADDKPTEGRSSTNGADLGQFRAINPAVAVLVHRFAVATAFAVYASDPDRRPRAQARARASPAPIGPPATARCCRRWKAACSSSTAIAWPPGLSCS